MPVLGGKRLIAKFRCAARDITNIGVDDLERQVMTMMNDHEDIWVGRFSIWAHTRAFLHTRDKRPAHRATGFQRWDTVWTTYGTPSHEGW